MGSLKDIMGMLGGDGLDDASDLIGTLGKVAAKAKPVPENSESASSESSGSGGLLGGLLGSLTDRPTSVRIKIVDGSGKEKRDFSLPISILKAGLDLGAESLNLDEQFDPSKLITLLETRNKGLLFDFDDPTDDDVIKIYLE